MTMYKEGSKNKAGHTGRAVALALSVVFLLVLAGGSTLAWLSAQSVEAENIFTPSQVTCKVTEEFDKETGVKTNVNVRNTGDTEAYIRVKLVTYRTNADGAHIGGVAELPEFTLGENWVKHDGYYYYTLPVAPGASPVANLTDSMTLVASYQDADGGSQAIDVMAEAIQSIPADAVRKVWGVSVSSDGTLSFN